MKTDSDLFGVVLILLGAILIGLMPAFAVLLVGENVSVVQWIGITVVIASLGLTEGVRRQSPP